jgi:hypothetical protein
MHCSVLFNGNTTEAELQQLKILLLDGEKRIGFLEQLEDRCVQTQCLDCKPFAVLCDILGEFIEECEYDDDYDALLRIYKLSTLICTAPNRNLQLGVVTCKASFETRYWASEMFWAQSVIDMIRRDMSLWSKITFIMRENGIKDIQLFGDMTGSQIRAVLVISRIQSVVASLRSLDLSNEVVGAVLQEISLQFGFENVGIDISATSTVGTVSPFLLRALTLASNSFLLALAKLKTAAQSKQKGTSALDTVYEKLALANNKVDFKPKLPSVPLHHEAGYCPLLELVFGLYVHLIKLHTMRETAAPSSAEEQAEQLRTLNSSPETVTRCFCGDAIGNWSFIDTNRCIERDISPRLSMILAAVAAGQDPRLLNSRGEVAAPPTRARSNSGRFNMSQMHNGPSFYSGASTEGVGSLNAPLTGTALCSRVLPNMMCERCYRHLMAPPLTLNGDTIVCTGVVPLPSHVAPMSADDVVFDKVMNVTTSSLVSDVLRSLYAEQAAREGKADEGRVQGMDFALFDRNLSALVKRQGQEAASSVAAGGTAASVSTVPKTSPVTTAAVNATVNAITAAASASTDVGDLAGSSAASVALEAVVEGKDSEAVHCVVCFWLLVLNPIVSAFSVPL